MKLRVRKFGNAAGIILPAALLRSLHIRIGSLVTAERVNGKLLLMPSGKQRDSLDELIAQCDPKEKPPRDIEAWGSMTDVGTERA